MSERGRGDKGRQGTAGGRQGDDVFRKLVEGVVSQAGGGGGDRRLENVSEVRYTAKGCRREIC